MILMNNQRGKGQTNESFVTYILTGSFIYCKINLFYKSKLCINISSVVEF